VFLAGTWQYIWYAKCPSKTYNEGDRTFYDAIIFEKEILTADSARDKSKAVSTSAMGDTNLAAL
jgi:hypothetical protein